MCIIEKYCCFNLKTRNEAELDEQFQRNSKFYNTMSKSNLLLLSIATFIFLISCKPETKIPTLEYNQKANELIQQLIVEKNCDCILEIPKENSMESETLENPSFDSKKYYTKTLSIKNFRELDSLSKIYQNFKLETKFIKARNIKVFKRDSLKILRRNISFFTKKCKNGITYFIKPNFNKNYNIAIISYGESGMCLSTGSKIYEYKNNEWNIK